MNKKDTNNDPEQLGILKQVANPFLNFKSAAFDRFSNPIFYSFILSWCIFNWDRLAILILSKQNIVDRISTVKNMPSNSTFIFDLPYANTIIFPMISTAFLVILSPFINNRLDLIHKNEIEKKIENKEQLNQRNYKEQTNTIDARINFEVAEELKRLEKREERAAILARTSESESKINNLKQQHLLLAETISNLQKSRDELTKENNALTEYISDLSLQHTKLIKATASQSKGLEEIKKEIGNATQQKDLILGLRSSLTQHQITIDEYKKQTADTKTLVNELLHYFENPPRDDNGNIITQDFEKRIYLHIQKYGLWSSTS